MDYGERIAKLEEAVKNLGRSIDDLRDNHIHSLAGKIESLENKFNNRAPIWAVTIITILSSATTGLLVRAFLK